MDKPTQADYDNAVLVWRSGVVGVWRLGSSRWYVVDVRESEGSWYTIDRLLPDTGVLVFETAEANELAERLVEEIEKNGRP